MGFGQLSSITTGGNKLGQLLFTGTIGKNDELKGTFEKVNNHKYIGSNSERLTADQNNTTRLAVVSALNWQFGKDKGVEIRLDAIKDYLTGEGQTSKSLYREEVGAMIDILKDKSAGLSDAEVRAKLEAVHAEQEFKQLRKMTVESDHALGNIVMTRSGGQFEKVNNHAHLKYKNNVDIADLGKMGSAWETDETTSDYIETVLQKHFADKGSKLNEAIQMAKNGEFGIASLTNRATLAKLIEYVEKEVSSEAFAAKAANIMAVKTDAEFCRFVDKLDAKTVNALDLECAKFLSESKNLTQTLLSPQGKYAVMRWANAKQTNWGVAKSFSQKIDRFLTNISNEVQDVIEGPNGNREAKLFKDFSANEKINEEDGGVTRSYKNPMDYFVRVRLYGQLESTKMNATSELVSGVARDLGKCKILKGCFDPPISLIFKNDALGQDNGKGLRVGLFWSAVHNAINKGVSQNDIAQALIDRNQVLLAEEKGKLAALEVGAGSAPTKVELTVEYKASQLGFKTRDEFFEYKSKDLNMNAYRANQKGIVELNPFVKRVDSFENARKNYEDKETPTKKNASKLRQAAGQLLADAQQLVKKYETEIKNLPKSGPMFSGQENQAASEKKVDLGALSLPKVADGEMLTAAELGVFNDLLDGVKGLGELTMAKNHNPPEELTAFFTKIGAFKQGCGEYEEAVSSLKESAKAMRTDGHALRKDIVKLAKKYPTNINLNDLNIPPAKGELLTEDELTAFSYIAGNGDDFRKARNDIERAIVADKNKLEALYCNTVECKWIEMDLKNGDTKSKIEKDELAAVGARMMNQAQKYYQNANQQGIGSGEFRLLQDALSDAGIQKTLGIKSLSAKTSKFMEFAIKIKEDISNPKDANPKDANPKDVKVQPEKSQVFEEVGI